MNKYQEALDKVICLLNGLSKEVIDTLKELVDKETAKKPIKRRVRTFVLATNGEEIMWNIEECPNCKEWIQSEKGENKKYCPYCAQKLDWGKEE